MSLGFGSMKDLAKAIDGPAWAIAGAIVLVALAVAYWLVFGCSCP